MFNGLGGAKAGSLNGAWGRGLKREFKQIAYIAQAAVKKYLGWLALVELADRMRVAVLFAKNLE